jgi:hypothetical protein
MALAVDRAWGREGERGMGKDSGGSEMGLSCELYVRLNRITRYTP